MKHFADNALEIKQFSAVFSSHQQSSAVFGNGQCECLKSFNIFTGIMAAHADTTRPAMQKRLSGSIIMCATCWILRKIQLKKVHANAKCLGYGVSFGYTTSQRLFRCLAARTRRKTVF
jgi:hypothetical protein